MWTESLLFHTLPKPIGNFLENYSMPLIGERSVLQLLPPFLILLLLVLCCSMLKNILLSLKHGCNIYNSSQE